MSDNFLLRNLFIKTFIVPFIVIFLLGCASSPSIRKNLLTANEHSRMLEKQKAEMAAEEKAAQKIPELNADGYEKLGDRYYQQGKYDLAFIQYTKSLSMDPNRLRVRYKTGQLFLVKGLNKEAGSEFQTIINVDAKYAMAYEGLGRVCLLNHDYENAKVNFQKAVQLNPSLWQSYNFLGIIYDRQNEYEKAIASYKAAISIQPEIGFLYNNLGISLALQGDKEKAELAFSEAIRLGTANPKVYNNMAMVLGHMGKYAEALEAFKKGGDEANAYYNLGCLLLYKGQPEKAIQAFDKAIELKPGFFVKAHQKIKEAKQTIRASSAQSPPSNIP
ncbi:MAG: tetratricopeptide repeat protein [Proteobacteria bacterium]|nr:tetratricopeptide repeat protein [Pseudomonadota bacterium]